MVYEIRYLPHSYWYQLCRLIRTYVEFHSYDSLLNSLWPTDAILRRRTRLLIVEVMACRLFGTGPLSESMLIYLNKHKLQGNLNRNVKIFTEQNVFENAVWKIEATVETLYRTIYYSKYFIELNFDKSTQYVALWTHKRHPIPRPFGRAMECLLWVLQQKLTVLERVSTVFCSGLNVLDIVGDDIAVIGFNIYWIKSLPMIVCHWYIILQTPYI